MEYLAGQYDVVVIGAATRELRRRWPPPVWAVNRRVYY